MSQPPHNGNGPEDYVHVHDAQAKRTRTELWAIVALVLVIVVGSLVWRAATGAKPGPPKGYGRTLPSPSSQAVTPGAGAGVTPRPI